MFQFKENKKTVKNFLDATRAVTGDTGTAFKDPLAYIGTFYDSVFLDKSIIAEPTLNIEIFGKEDVKFKVVLKPDASQLDQIQLLDDYLNTINMGYMDEQLEQIVEPGSRLSISQAFLAQQSGISDIQNYSLNVYFNEPTVTRQDTTINGIKYYLFTLTDTYNFGEGIDYTHSMHCMFKERVADGENFFSGLVGKELNIKDSKKVLDTLAGNNMTGMFIGGYSFGDKGVFHQVFAISSELALTVNEGYILKGYGTYLEVPDETIKSLVVSRVSDYRYNVELETTDGRITLYIG